MRAKLGLFFIITLAGIIIGFSLAFEHNRTYFEGIPILWEDTLKHIGMEQMRSFGLIGEPTESNSTLVKTGGWSGSMFSSTGLNTPNHPYYILSVKGEFKYVPRTGFSLPGDVEDKTPPEGYTVALDATNGNLYYSIGRYIEDIPAETTDEDRAMYESLRNSNLHDLFEVEATP